MKNWIAGLVLLAVCTALTQTASAQPGRGGRGEMYKRILEKYDANKDGKLDEKERQKAREGYVERARERRAEWMKKIDKDGDGKISDKEKEAARETMKKEWEARRKAAAEKSSPEAKKPAARPGPSRRPTPGARSGGPPSREEFMKRFDKDKDGKISEKEKEAIRAEMKKRWEARRKAAAERSSAADKKPAARPGPPRRPTPGARPTHGRRPTPGARPGSPPSREAVRKRFDANKDGKLTGQELEKARAAMKKYWENRRKMAASRPTPGRGPATCPRSPGRKPGPGACPRGPGRGPGPAVRGPHRHGHGHRGHHARPSHHRGPGPRPSWAHRPGPRGPHARPPCGRGQCPAARPTPGRRPGPPGPRMAPGRRPGPPGARPTPGRRPMGPPSREMIMKHFDKDSDGKLSEKEREALREAFKKRMEARRKMAAASARRGGPPAARPTPGRRPGGPSARPTPGRRPGAPGPQARRPSTSGRSWTPPSKEEFMKKFDKDGDGKLSEKERETVRAEMKKRWEARRKAAAEKKDD